MFQEAPNDTSMLSNYSPLPDSTRDKSIGEAIKMSIN